MSTITHTRRPRMSLQRRRVFLAYLYLAPALLGLLIFLVIPLVWGIWLSFNRYTPGVPTVFIGLENYARVFEDQVVRAAFGNVLKYSLGVIPILVVLPLLMAFPLNRTLRGIGFFRAGVYFPHVISMVVMATMFIYLYRSDGLFNQLIALTLRPLGIEWEPISFLKKSNWALPAVMFVTIFKATGYYAILYLAGLQNVPIELVEAAMIDGANWRQRLWHVILPQIRPMATLVVIVAMIGSLKLFGEVFVMTNGGPGLTTQSLMLTVYQQAFQQFRFGYASALAIVMTLGILLLTILSLRFSERNQG
ncbi:MAG: sugar ABC transporter permease [Caldilineaceae bacterium]